MKRFFFQLGRFLFSWESWDVSYYRYTLIAMDRATKELQRKEGAEERGMRIDINKMVRDYKASQQRKRDLNKRFGKFGK